MQGQSWVALFRLIPVNLHETLVLITTTGIEVLVQSILRLDDDYLIVRGRMSGSTDGGRVMILPYDQISNLAFNRRMLEPEVQAIFGTEAPAAFAPPLAGVVKTAADSTPAEQTPGEGLLELPAEEAPLAPDALPPSPDGKGPKPTVPAHPSKSLLLARLRARLAGGPK